MPSQGEVLSDFWTETIGRAGILDAALEWTGIAQP